MTKISDLHKAVIDNYFSNGFNQVQAYLKAQQDTPYQQASSMARLILNSDKNKAYKEQKQDEITREKKTKCLK